MIWSPVGWTIFLVTSLRQVERDGTWRETLQKLFSPVDSTRRNPPYGSCALYPYPKRPSFRGFRERLATRHGTCINVCQVAIPLVFMSVPFVDFPSWEIKDVYFGMVGRAPLCVSKKGLCPHRLRGASAVEGERGILFWSRYLPD